VKNDGYDPDKITGGGRPETPEKNDVPELLKLWAEYKDSCFKRVPGVEAGTILPAGSSEPKCWWATIETISGNDYNLAAGRYKPQIAEKPPEEDPVELIQEVLTIERQIIAGLENLFKEVAE
jgi:type I restriction enzyme M protein